MWLLFGHDAAFEFFAQLLRDCLRPRHFWGFSMTARMKLNSAVTMMVVSANIDVCEWLWVQMK